MVILYIEGTGGYAVRSPLSSGLHGYDGKHFREFCGWAKVDMSKSFFFNLVPNKGTLVSPVSYSFSPEEIYKALKDKYEH